MLDQERKEHGREEQSLRQIINLVGIGESKVFETVSRLGLRSEMVMRPSSKLYERFMRT